MKRFLPFLSLIALLTLTQSATSSTRISGRVLGFDGAPPRMGKALVSRMVDAGLRENFFPGKSLIHAEIQKDGRFELTIPKSGWYKLVITAVDHEFVGIPLAISDTDTIITLTAQLAPVQIEPDADIYLLGSWNHFDLRKGTKTTRAADGTFY